MSSRKIDYKKLLNAEINTIDAINKLDDKEQQIELPYAKALLIYSLIERLLKIYIIKERSNLNNIDEYSKINDNYKFYVKFFEENKIKLKDIIRKYIKNINRSIPKARHNIVHSIKYFLRGIHALDKERRIQIYRKFANKGLIDLKNVWNTLFSKYLIKKLSIKNNKIEFISLD